MPPLAASAIPAFLRHTVSPLLPSSCPPLASSLIPLLTATTLGHGPTWLAPCLAHALEAHPPLPEGQDPPPEIEPHLASSSSPSAPDAQQHPRRLIVAQFKEALVKSAILIGVPRAIETLLHLDDAVLDKRDLSRAFVRRALEESEEEGSGETRATRGREGLRTVYKGNLDAIFARMRNDGLEDLRFISERLTYGTFLTPFSSSSHSPDPLSSDPRLLSLVTLPCLLSQRTPREIHWHLRGALRRGWTREDVERVQRATEVCAEACGVDRVGEAMPRVEVVERQEEEEEEGPSVGDRCERGGRCRD